MAQQANTQNAVQALNERMDQRFRLKMHEERIPGSAWTIVHQGKVQDIAVHGFVDSRHSKRVDEATVFRIASVSKGFAGVLTAMLATEGQLSLQDPIRQYAPSFRFKSAGSNVELTIEDVLGQRSGFVPNAYDNMIESGISRQQIYPHFAELAPICPPRTCYSYQNSVFSLVEDVIETSTSVPYAELLEQRIFEPL
ncbi:MAG: serine hydrolase domain-containing protein, partial [Pseudomonadota bacterium]